jgi:hypothetical protein
MERSSGARIIKEEKRMDIREGIGELGFTKSYDLLDEMTVIGEAWVRNGYTLCLKYDKVTLFDRWTGKLILDEILNRATFQNIKRRLN